MIASVLAAGGCDDKPKNPSTSEPGAAPVKSAPPKKKERFFEEPADIYGPPPAMDEPEPAPKAVEPEAAEPKPEGAESAESKPKD